MRVNLVIEIVEDESSGCLEGTLGSLATVASHRTSMFDRGRRLEPSLVPNNSSYRTREQKESPRS